MDTPAKQREWAYNSVKLIQYGGGEDLTVTEAATLYGYYFAEGRADVCAELQPMIAWAKNLIRQRYPDEN